MNYETMRIDLVNAGVRAATTEEFLSAFRETEALCLTILRAAQRGESQLTTTLRDDLEESRSKLDEAVTMIMAQSAELGTKIRALCEGDGLLPSAKSKP